MAPAWQSLVDGLPVLIIDLAVTLALLTAGIAAYMSVAPYRELALVREGNVAAAIILVAQTFALAIPLAAMLAHSVSIPDIILWGIVALLLQFVAVGAVRLAVPGLPTLIQHGKVAPALVAAGALIVTGLLNAAALSD